MQTAQLKQILELKLQDMLEKDGSTICFKRTLFCSYLKSLYQCFRTYMIEVEVLAVSTCGTKRIIFYS